VIHDADVWLAGRVKRGEISSLTRRNYQRAIASFARYYGERPLERMTRLDIDRWLEENPHWKPGTRRHHWSVVKDFCGWLVLTGKMHRSPFDGTEAPKGSRPAPSPIPANDVDTLVVSLPDARARLIVALMYELGLRCASVSALQITDLDWVNREIHVVGKGNRHYSVPLTDTVAHAVSAYLDEYPASAGPLIRSYVRPWAPIKATTIGDMVGAWMRDAGVKKARGDRRSAHGLRTTALTETARATEDPYTVQALAGHSSIATAAWYVPRVGTRHVALGLQKRRALRDVP
jgi:site-specific recombinase XerC